MKGNKQARRTFERFDWSILTKSTNVNALIGGTGSERVVSLPVDVQRRRRMKSKLLRATAVRGVPYDGSFINAGRQNVVAFFIPL